MNFKDQVNKILDDRKKQKEKIDANKQKISNLKKQIVQIKKIVEQANQASLMGFSEKLDKIVKSLSSAESTVKIMEKRFSGDTVNIGAAGPARVGKSTVLQTLTGLKDEQIPTGDFTFVTAVRSCIWNIPSNQAPYADVYFYNLENFVKARISPFTAVFGVSPQISTIDEIGSFDIPLKNNDENENADKTTAREKLIGLQENLEKYRELLEKGEKGTSVRVNNLEEIEKYVSYNDSYLYAPVEHVDIYCHFPSLDDVPLKIVDLPGLGEINGVDDIQTSGLGDEIDHAIVVFKANDAASCNMDQKNHRVIESINDVQSEIKNRKKFLSVMLNQYKGAESYTEHFKGELLKYVPDTVDESINLYTVDATNQEKVNEMRDDIISRMIHDIPEVDKMFMKKYEGLLNYEEIKNQLEEIEKIIRSEKNNFGGETRVRSDIANKLREDINYSIGEYRSKYNQNSLEDLGKKVNEIYENIENEIQKPLFFEPSDDYSSWEEKMKKKGLNSATQMYPVECDRLRVAILESYTELNKYYNEKLEGLKEDLIKIFRKYTGSFSVSTLKGSASIDQIREKLRLNISDKNAICQALDYLMELKLDFRQHIYPIIFSSKDVDLLDPDKNPMDPHRISFIDVNVHENMKELLQCNAKQNNAAIRQAILEHDITDDYLKSALIHFRDLLIVVNEKVEYDFQDFVEAFENDIQITGSSSSKEIISALHVKIQETLKLVSEMED